MKILFCKVCSATIGVLDDDDINEDAKYNMRCKSCAIAMLLIEVREMEKETES